jgi:SAM-dependent MidA family methyltransferase
LIEPSPALRRLQERRLEGHAARVRWLEAADPAGTALGAGCVFANEVLDALPVHRVLMTEAGLQEMYVDVQGGRLRAREGPLSTAAISQQITAGGGQLAPGQRGEVNRNAPELVRSLAGLVEPGYVLLLDYGAPARTLYGADFPAGTLRCYWRHTLSRDPLRRVGRQDITAHVDLTAVTRAAEASGLILLGATRQARLLDRLGSDMLRSAVLEAGWRRMEERAHLAALSLLGDPRELGGLAALVFGRSAPGHPLAGFTDQPEGAPDIPIWLLQLRSSSGEIARSAGPRTGQS